MKRFFAMMRSQKGAVNLGGLILMGLGLVFIGVGFIMFPVVIEGAEGSRLAATATTEYAYNVTTADNNTVSFNVSGRVAGDDLVAQVTSVSSNHTGDSPTANNVTSTGTVIGISGLGNTGDNDVSPNSTVRTLTVGYNDWDLVNYTGTQAIVEVGPTIALVAFLFGGVVAGYFGIKVMRGG